MSRNNIDIMLSSIEYIIAGNQILVNGTEKWGSFTQIAIINSDRSVKWLIDAINQVKVAVQMYADFANPKNIDNQFIFNTKVPDFYIITGENRYGKRFTIHTTSPQHYNIWSGTLWLYVEGKRKLVKRYRNAM